MMVMNKAHGNRKRVMKTWRRRTVCIWMPGSALLNFASNVGTGLLVQYHLTAKDHLRHHRHQLAELSRARARARARVPHQKASPKEGHPNVQLCPRVELWPNELGLQRQRLELELRLTRTLGSSVPNGLKIFDCITSQEAQDHRWSSHGCFWIRLHLPAH